MKRVGWWLWTCFLFVLALHSAAAWVRAGEPGYEYLMWPRWWYPIQGACFLIWGVLRLIDRTREEDRR